LAAATGATPLIEQVWGWIGRFPRSGPEVYNDLCLGFDDYCLISREFNDATVVGGTMELVGMEEESRRPPEFCLRLLEGLWDRPMLRGVGKWRTAPRAMTVNDLPILGSVCEDRMFVALPCGHLGFSQYAVGFAAAEWVATGRVSIFSERTMEILGAALVGK
jgi:glycine/D-amino acid oxidase-like deaminating enzyme